MGVTLDNPVWHSLCDAHSSWGQGTAHTKWYPPDVAPFLAVAEPVAAVGGNALAASDLRSAYIVGVAPDVLPDGWRVEATSPVLQMIHAGEPVAADDRPFVELSAAHRPQMFELAGIAFPDFFRPRTGELGTYFGVFTAGQLVAMAGERMAFGDFREISGVCTHPDHAGHGYASHLSRVLLERHRLRGWHSFLHVSANNIKAAKLYEKLGFARRAVLTMWKVGRAVTEERDRS
jgi:ribosomal protein S18 acetylase RimI-like enzyme